MKIWFNKLNNSEHFQDKLFKTFMLVGIIPLIFLAMFFYSIVSSFIENKVNNSVEESLRITSGLIDSTINMFINITNYVSNNKEIKDILESDSKNPNKSYDEKFADTQKIYKIVNNVLATQSMEVPLHIVNNLKRSRFSTTDYMTPIYKNKQFDFYDCMKKNENETCSCIHSRVDGKNAKDTVMVFGRVIKNSTTGQQLGYAILDVYDDYFNEILNNVKVFTGNNIYILNKQGYIITDKIFKNKTGFKFYERYVNDILNKKKGSFNCNIDNKEYIAYFYTAKVTGIKIVELIPKYVIYQQRRLVIVTFFIITIMFCFIAIVTSYIFSNNISKPISKLSDLMKKVKSGDRNVNFDIKSNDEIGNLGNSFNEMLKEINRLIEEVYIKQYLLQEAEFKALKSQVNPHFLYNTLESINWMAKLGDSKGVSVMVTTLGKFLRYGISKKGDIVTVREELQQTENYLTIQKIRYGKRFEISFQVEEDIYDKKMLKLLIQPLVENAIIHGLEPKVGSGILIIRGFKKNKNIEFCIMDNGVGMGKSNTKGEGIGMENVNKRIKLKYGEDYGLKVEVKNEFTCVSFEIPTE